MNVNASIWEGRARPEEAATAFAALAEKYPDHALAADAKFYQAVALRDAGRDQQAVDVLEDFLKRHENNEHAPQARQLIAQACYVSLEYLSVEQPMALHAVDILPLRLPRSTMVATKLGPPGPKSQLVRTTRPPS